MSNSHTGGAGASSRVGQLESLERREMPAVFNFDFGTATSPVASGYTGVPVAAYNSSLGFGWQSTSGVQGVDYGGTNYLTRDVQTAQTGTFLVDVPNGQYDVAVTLGDPTRTRDQVTVTAEGTTIVSNLTTAAGQQLQARGRVTVADGQLTLKLTDGGGVNSRFAVAALTVSSVDTSANGLWSSAVTPGTASWNDSSAVEVGVKFQSSVNGTVSGVQFYKGTGNTGTHTGSLWTASGRLLAKVTFTNETATGWQTATFSTPVAITANTTYIVSYFAPNGRYAADTDYFTASGLQSGSLRALSSAEGGNGVYRYGSTSGFPNQSFKGTNYWVDVVFQPAGVSPPPASPPPASPPPASPPPASPPPASPPPAAPAPPPSDAPTANAGADRTTNEGTRITFNGSATGTGLTYQWNFGDGTTASGTLTPSKTYADNGTYTVTLTVTDSLGRTASDTAVVTVNNVAPTATLSNDSPKGPNQTVTISFGGQTDPSSADTSAGFRYYYDFDNNGTWEVANSPSPTAGTTFTQVGTYTARGRIVDKDGGFTDYTTAITITNGSGYSGILRTVYVSPTGTDGGAGSSTNPWKTLQYAANNARPGDMIVVRAGTYVGFQVFSSGTAANPIVFKADPGVLVNAKAPSASSNTAAINLESASYVAIDGFQVVFANYGSAWSNIRTVGTDTNPAHGVIIRNNVIDNASWWGILTGFSEGVLIENNRVTNTVIQHGIYVGYGADNPVVRGNFVQNSRYSGIQLNADASGGGDGIITNAVIENNTLLDNSVAGGASINLDGVQSSLIRNNVIYGNRNGIALFQQDAAGGAKNNTIVGNTIVFDPGAGYYAVSIISGSDASSGNKLFDNILWRDGSSYRGSIVIDAAARVGFQSDYNVTSGKFNLDPVNESQPVTLAQWQAQTGQDTHSVTVTDPTTLFVDMANNNFRLRLGSIAINRGTNLAALPADMLGVGRPLGGASDIGAYESY